MREGKHRRAHRKKVTDPVLMPGDHHGRWCRRNPHPSYLLPQGLACGWEDPWKRGVALPLLIHRWISCWNWLPLCNVGGRFGERLHALSYRGAKELLSRCSLNTQSTRISMTDCAERANMGWENHHGSGIAIAILAHSRCNSMNKVFANITVENMTTMVLGRTRETLH